MREPYPDKSPVWTRLDDFIVLVLLIGRVIAISGHDYDLFPMISTVNDGWVCFVQLNNLHAENATEGISQRTLNRGCAGLRCLNC